MEIALGFVSGWWERNLKTSLGRVADSSRSKGDSGCECGRSGASKCDDIGDYPMDYYAQDGGEWNFSYVKKSSRPARRILVPSAGSNSIA
ncbi:hypothetical protein NL676_039420 [Syzygium grande]|nr:hypothetical protein NL676_039420 [Syzygium grande]